MYNQCKKAKWDIIIDLRSSLLSYLLKTKKRFIFKKDKKYHHIDQLKKYFKIQNTSLNIYTNKEEEGIVKKDLSLNNKYKDFINLANHRVISSVGLEHYLDRVGVGSSNLPSPTLKHNKVSLH